MADDTGTEAVDMAGGEDTAGGTDVADGEDTTRYAVVVNDEEQYSLWPDDRPLPHGWHREGTVGSEQQCLAHIEQVWTDMRPAALRQWMAQQSGA